MKQILIDTLKGKPTHRTPWVPFVGVHGGFLIDKDAQTYLQSADALYEGIHQAIIRYKPDGIPLAFDLQIEAEILGCELRWAKDSPPCVVTHPLADHPDLVLPLPTAESGRIPLILEALDRLKSTHPDVAFFGLITGPLTLATHLMGTELLTHMILEPEIAEEVLGYSTRVAKAMASLYAEKGVDVIAVVDPMLSQIAPRTFKRFLPDLYGQIFDHIRSSGCLSASFVCGDARKNLSGICETGPDSLFVDENVPLSLLRDCTKEHKVAFGGNIPLANILLSGSPEMCQLSATECIYEAGKTGYVLAPGCDLLYATPPENLAAISEMVHNVAFEEMGTLIATLSAQLPKQSLAVYNPPVYASQKNVIIDVITLNSQSCAACQYMVEAVRILAEENQALPITWQEHRITETQTLSMIQAFGVKGIPSIVIDGKVAFESVVPSREELLSRLQQIIEEKK